MNMINYDTVNKRNGMSRVMIKAAILTVLVLMVFSGNMWQVNALSEGNYILKTIPDYYHPVTDKIEDSGQNAAIGQGMTESVLGDTALLEVYPDDTKYLTVRFGLMDNISDIRISYQNSGDTDYQNVEYQIMQKDDEEYTEDMRFEVPDEKVIVRFEFYVEAMGRDVIFFSTFSDAQEGTGDFIVTEYEKTSQPVEKEGYTIYMTIAFALAAALIVIVIVFIGYVYYTRKVIKKLKNERM